MLPWLRLLRISALPSAISNILVGYLLAHQNWNHPDLWLLILTSSFLYLAGMISNDVFDVERDAALQSKRPLVTGEIASATATSVYIAMMFAAAATTLFLGVRSQCIVLLLIIFILAYNGFCKTFFWAPVLMGCCRGLNILLGASSGIVSGNSLLGWSATVWWIAISLTIYVSGLTFFARHETLTNSQRWLANSLVVMMVGIIGYATAQLSETIFGSLRPKLVVNGFRYPLLICAVALPVFWRTVTAIQRPGPKRIKMAIVISLQSMIVLDAGVCFLVSGAFFYPLVVLALLLPSKWLSAFISPT